MEQPDTSLAPEVGVRRVTTAIVAGAVIIAFLIACPCAIFAIVAGRGFVADSRVEYATWVASSQWVAWSGDGRFGVAQVIGADGTPEVVSWDRQSGRVRRVAGYRLAAVERYGAAAWLVPVSQGELTERLDGEWRAVLVPAGGAFDGVPDSLSVWRLDGEDPAAVPPREPVWVRWPGPGAWSVTAVVDPARGAYPSAISVGSSDSPADDRAVSLPGDLGTFDVVGWSATGRYLALAEMISSEEVEPDGVFERRLLVVDASDARVVSTAVQRVRAEAAPPPVWDEERDLMLWVDEEVAGAQSALSSLEPVVIALEPGGSPRPVDELLGTADLAQDGDLRAVAVYRSDPDGVVIASAGTLVRRSAQGHEVVAGSVGDATSPAVYHRNGGWLVLAQESDGDPGRLRDVLWHLEDEGGQWTAVWTGEWRSGE